jgi:hypothetical protein
MCELSNSGQLPSPTLPHNTFRFEAAIATVLRRAFHDLEIYVTYIQLLLGGFALLLIIIFGVAAFLDERRRRAARIRGAAQRSTAN